MNENKQSSKLKRLKENNKTKEQIKGVKVLK